MATAARTEQKNNPAEMAADRHQDPSSGGGESLKNGTGPFEESDDSGGGGMVVGKNRGGNNNNGRDSSGSTTSDPSFQDGGTANSRAVNSVDCSSPYGLDSGSSRRMVNSTDFQGFNQSSGSNTSSRDSNLSGAEDYRSGGGAQDNYNHGCSDVGGGYNRGYDQHSSSETPNSQPAPSNKMYPQYNQPQMRPGYPSHPQNPRNMTVTSQSRPPMGAYVTNSSQQQTQQQRFLSGPSITQQTGPTPTLNQLLQAPNTMQRYHNSYEYQGSGQSLHKGMGESSQYPGPNNTWGAMRSSYPQQMNSPMYRNQETFEFWFTKQSKSGSKRGRKSTKNGGSLSEPSMKRPYGGPPGQMSSPSSGPLNQGGGGGSQYPPSHQQSQQQYHHSSYGHQSSQQQQPSQGTTARPPMGQGYPQQGMQQYPSQTPSHTPTSNYEQQQQQHTQRQPSASSAHQYTTHQSHLSQQQAPHHQPQPSPQQQTPPSQQPPPPQQQQQQQQQQPPPPTSQQSASQPQPASAQHQSQGQQSPQVDLNSGGGSNSTSSTGSGGGSQEDSLPSSDVVASGGSSTPGLRTPTTPPHPVVSPHRPVPSPSGASSVGSPSMSPALGQQQNIPMPPRPSSSQSESGGQSPMSQPPMGAQGYTQQMAPPGMYGNKMHQNMMGNSGSSHVGPYPSQPQGHYAQGSYHRPSNSMGMQGYGNQSPNSYPSPTAGPTYPSQGAGPSHRMQSHPSTGAAPPSYNTSNTSGYQSTQYGNSGPPAASPQGSGYGTNSMMPPPNQYPKANTMPPPTGGAQAAAQAAVMAAAASSTGMRQPSMYIRQHLQQKIYPSNYSGSAMSPSSTPSSDTSSMLPPSSTPSSQSLPPQGTSPSATMTTGSSGDSSAPSSSSMSMAACFTQTSAPSLGQVSTTTTQSISSPVPSAVTVSSPSVMSSDMMPSPQNRGPLSSGLHVPQPPPIMDEGSQASNASASSSLPEERVETPKPNSKPMMSHPPTPNTLSSPGAASMSSFHDEFESVSSPSWPRTPASPVINNQAYDHHPIKVRRPDGMLKLYDMSDDPDRRLFLDKLISYSEERGTPINQCPTISKQPLDLYRLYLACKERGGFVEVMKAKLWKDIAGLVGIGASSSAAYTLRKQYIKHLLPFECKYDRGGIDPGPIISSFESNSRKKNAAKNAMMNQEAYHQGGPMMDGYPSSYPGAYPPSSGPHHGMMASGDYPGHHAPYNDPMHPSGGMPNHSGSEGAMDPFGDDMSSSQYPQQRHSSGDGYGYSQPSANSGMPPYSGNQSNMQSSTPYGYSGTPVPPPDSYGDQYSGSGAGPPPPPPSDPSYGNRSMLPDPYATPGSYPPNKTIGPNNPPPQYPPYQGPCDQDSRYDQPPTQGPMLRPPSAGSGMGPSGQGDPTNYPPHRYPNQQMAPREGMPPNQQMGGMYQGRPPMSQSQYPGPNSQPSGQQSYPQSQQDSYRGPEYPPQMSRLQSTLIQRLQPKNHTIQGYQQNMYGQAMAPPPNKVAPQSNMSPSLYQQRDMYSMGPKRHGDFTKSHPAQDQYHMGSYPQQQTQGPYTDRSQYSYRPSHSGPAPVPPQSGWSRDGRQYPPGPGQYQAGHRDGWDMSRHDGPPPGNSPWPRYGGPQDPYSHMGPNMGPKVGYNRGYMSPNKMPPHPGIGPPPQYGSTPGRKEIIFPPDSVEAVTPVMTKRRRLLSKDLSTIDPWRLMMALKSGLLCESTWALDVLSILICDDATVLYFGLSHLPGLLEVLMDHYRRCLNLIFDLADDLEIGFIGNHYRLDDSEHKKKDCKWYELEKDVLTEEQAKDHLVELLSGERMNVLKTHNYTHTTRCRKPVKEKHEEALFLYDPDKEWDVYEGFLSGSSHWQHGGGESTGYIQMHFENSERCVRFARIMTTTKNEEVEPVGDTTEQCENGNFCRKECNSDTEEDDSLFANSPGSRLETKSSENPKGLENCDKSAHLEEETIKCEPEDHSEEQQKLVDDTNQNDTENVKIKQEDKSDESNIIESQKDELPTESSCPRLRPLSPGRKRRLQEDLEDESYNRDEASLCVTTDAQDSLVRRCISISSLLRNLSFVPGNDTEMSKHSGFLMIVGRLLLLHHVHSQRKPPQRHYDREEEGENTAASDSCSSLNSDHEWWWDMLHLLRENSLVTLANISGQLDLAPFPEEISFPLLDGLIHWVTCPSSYAQDPLPTQPSQSVLSPQRLSLEALCKLSVLESNVDLMMATPPWQRIDRFFSLLSKWLSRNEDQVLREFSVVLLSNLSQADSSMARAIALQGSCIPLLITFVEQAEQSALQVANSQGINALRENPELMGTTLDMVRRAAGTLRCLARVPTNRTLFLHHQQRLLALVMSQILDQGVASIIADVLFECSQECLQDSISTTDLVKPPAPTFPSPST